MTSTHKLSYFCLILLNIIRVKRFILKVLALKNAWGLIDFNFLFWKISSSDKIDEAGFHWTKARNWLLLKSNPELEDLFGCLKLRSLANHIWFEYWYQDCARILPRYSMDTYSNFLKAFFYTSIMLKFPRFSLVKCLYLQDLELSKIQIKSLSKK